MTDRRALRNLAGLALIPAAAGVFGASVTWAAGHDPMATTAAPTSAPTPEPAALPVPAVPEPDQRLVDLTAQVVATQARIAQLQAVVEAQRAAAAAVPAPAAPAAPAPARPAARPAPAAAPAPAPAPAPPVDTTTGASG